MVSTMWTTLGCAQADRERAERAADELSFATFQPEISRMAQQLWSRGDGSAVPAWQRLSKGERARVGPRVQLTSKPWLVALPRQLQAHSRGLD